jgi:endoglucanase
MITPQDRRVTPSHLHSAPSFPAQYAGNAQGERRECKCLVILSWQKAVMASLLTSLKHLSNVNGVSGDESAVRQIVIELIRAHVDDLRVDTMGNVLAVKRARGKARLRVMLDAHMDEVGFMIFGANSDGTLKFRAVGRVDDRILPGKVVLVGPDRIPGVIGVKPVHLLDGETSVLKIEDLAIDIGAANESEANSAVAVGQTAIFATEFRTWNGAASGKALDDRTGCAVLIEILRGPRLPVEILAAFTVQEEVGLRGAKVAAHAFDPDAAVAVDATPANDLPPTFDQDVSPNTRLGDGRPSVMTRRDLSDPRLVKHFMTTGDTLKIPYQIRQPGGSGTNAGSIIPARSGVPTISVSVPARYLHSPASLIYLKDVRSTVALVRESVARLTPQVLKKQ